MKLTSFLGEAKLRHIPFTFSLLPPFAFDALFFVYVCGKSLAERSPHSYSHLSQTFFLSFFFVTKSGIFLSPLIVFVV